MSQSTRLRPDAEAGQSHSAAHRDGSLAPNPPAGLVPKDHPTKRSRRGSGGVRVLAAVACLAWLAWPTEAFAQQVTLNVDAVAGDNKINRSEHTNGIAVSGNTGTESGVTVEVTIGGTPLTSVTSAMNAMWSVNVERSADYITETSVELSVTATKTGFTSATVTRTLPVDLTPPSVSYTAPSNLTVGILITPIAPTTSDTDIVSYATSGGSLPLGLALNGNTGIISGSPRTANTNTQTVGVLVTDDAGNVARPQITFPAVELASGVMVSETELTVPEGGSASYTLVLVTQPTDDVTITVERVTGDEDLTASPGTLTFTNSNWSVQQTVTVSAAEDDDGEAGTAQFGHNVISPGTVYHGVSTPGLRTTEDDNDTIGVIVSPTALSVPEGGSATYTVRLGTKPLYDVTVEVTRDQRSDADLTVSSDTDTDADINSVTLPFTNLNWNTEQTVTVTAAEDADEVDDVAIFSHTTASFDDNYYPIDIDGVTATEADNEKVVTVAIQTEVSAPVRGVFEVTIIFSEAVTGFERSEIAVTNGSVTDFSGSAPTYKAEITPSKSGEVIVEVGANVVEYGVGNGNIAGAPLVLEADPERPEVTIEVPTEPVGIAGFKVRITFSEPVEGFELEDIQVTNGTASNFTKISPQEYTATITPEGTGEVRVEVGSNVARDGAGNGNQAAEAFELETKLAVSYQEESYTAREGGETVTVTVKLSLGWDEELAIPIRVTRPQPESTEVDDYTVDGLEEWDAQEGTGKLTFSAGETEQTFTIAANDDEDGEDEELELGFGDLPTAVMAGDPAVATVTLEDKGLVELTVSFGQAEYEIREGQEADIEVTVSPATDRRVEVPLVVVPKGGATDEDYSGVPASLVFEEGESQGTISVKVLADEVGDPGESIVLSFGELPEAVSEGEISQTTVNFTQWRTAEQFSQTLEVMLAVLARSTAASAQSAIQGRFERHRQWSRLGAAGGAVPTAQPGSDNSATGLGEGESQRIDSESLEGAGRRRAEGLVVPSAGGAAGGRAAMGSSGESGDRESGVQGAWLQNVSLGGLAGLFGYGQGYAGVSTGSGMGPSGTGPTFGLGGQPGYGQNRFLGSGTRDSSLRSGSGEYSGRRNRELNLAGISFEMPLGKQEQGKSTSWVPVLWGQGDLQHFNGDLDRLGMNYRGRLEAAHVGLDLYANDQVLAGLSFMRSWGDMDYTDDGVDGVLGSDLNTFHPYLYWEPNERVSMWGFGGMGWGEVDVKELGRTHDFDADFRMLAGGVRSVLCRWPCNELALRADAFTAQLRTDATNDIAKVSGEAHRARLMLEWVHDLPLAAGRSLSLQLEAGGRFDGGDADRGAGVETGFRLGYLDANSGLDVVMLGRVLVVHESDYRDWGLGVQASWDPGEKQRGFRVSVTSTRGQDGVGRTTLWNNANMVTRPPGMGAMGMSSQSRMEIEVAYYGGLKTLGLPGLLTPYSRLRWAGQGRELAWGTAWSLPPRLQLALPLMLELEAMRRENSMGPADLAVLVRMSIPF